MLASQRVQMKMSELRQKVNGLPETRESKAEYDAKCLELNALEADYRKALEAEAKETDGAEFNSAETAEVRGLIQRASAAGIISAVALHRVSDGAEGELQRALGVGGDVVPWQLMENRAAATFTANTGEASLGQVHRQSLCGQHCRVCWLPSGYGACGRGRLSHPWHRRLRGIPDR